jgi:hypothetical protein
MEGYSVGYCDLCQKGANTRLYFLGGQRFCAVCFPAAVNIKIANEKLKPTPKTYPAAEVDAYRCKVAALVEAAKKAKYSMEHLCDYAEDHRLAIGLIDAALAALAAAGGGECTS